jgi:uncharacterized delta-60 repeat protein
LQNDGKIVVGGRNNILRLNSNGILDNTFGNNGKISYINSLSFISTNVAIQTDGKIIAAGYIGSDFVLSRFDNNGILDKSFSTGINISKGIFGEVFSIALQEDNKIVAVGFKDYNNKSYFALARYHGSLVLLSNPTDKIICKNANTSFKVRVANVGNFQWQFYNGTNWNNISNNSNYSGANDSILNVINTPVSFDSLQYRCIVSDDTKIDTTTSALLRVVDLQVNADVDKFICFGDSVNLKGTISTNHSEFGNLNFVWSPTQNIINYSTLEPTVYPTVTKTYSLKVTDQNACSVTDNVIVNVTNLTVNLGNDKIVKCGENIQLNASTNYSGIEPLTFVWLPTSDLNDSTVSNPSTKVYQNINYSVNVTTNIGCKANDEIKISLTPLQNPNICIVDINEANKNSIIWNKEISSVIDSFYIYKETNIFENYKKIASVNYNEISNFVDLSSNAQIQSNRYKLSLKDVCGLESTKSDAHKTMHLTINEGANKDWNLIWEQYLGFTVQTYNIYRGSKHDNLELIGTTSSISSQYSDFSAPSGNVYYQVEVVSPTACNPSKSIYSSRSNIATNNPNAINDLSVEDLFLVFPNPAKNELTIQLNQNFKFNETTCEIINIDGQVVKNIKL